MTSRVTSMTNYTTLEYRDKIEKEQEAAINRLLEILPLYVTDYYSPIHSFFIFLPIIRIVR